MKKVFKDLIPEYLRESLQILKGKKIYTDEFNKTKSIFIHIPKCAGTSIGEAIYGDKKIGHYTAEDFFYINKSKFNNYYKFTVIRDPLDRCYSAFHYLKSEKCTKNDNLCFPVGDRIYWIPEKTEKQCKQHVISLKPSQINCSSNDIKLLKIAQKR